MAEWAAEPVWTRWQGEKLPAPAERESITYRTARSPVIVLSYIHP